MILTSCHCECKRSNLFIVRGCFFASLIAMTVTLMVLFFYPTLSWAKAIQPFEGQINLSEKNVHLDLTLADQGSISAHIDRSFDQQFHTVVDINHLKISNFDLSTQLEINFQRKMSKGLSQEKTNSTANPEKFVLTGTIASQYTLFNLQP